MIVAVAAVRMVEVAADEKIRVAAVRHGRVSASRAVDVAGLVPSTSVRRRARVRIPGADLDRAFVDVIAVHGMETAVVEVVDVVSVADGGVDAALAVDVSVLGMDPVVWHGQIPVISKTASQGYNAFEESFSLIKGSTSACMEWTAAKRCRCCASA